MTSFTCYQCDEGICNTSAEHLSFCGNGIQCWKSSLRDNSGSIRYARGCITKPEYLRLLCSSRIQGSNSKYRTECCGKDFCNSGAFPILDDPVHPIDDGINAAQFALSMMATFLTISLIIIAIFLYHKSRAANRILGQHRRPRVLKVRPYSATISISSSSLNSSEPKMTPASDTPANENLQDQIPASGSGSSKPKPTQESLSKQISLVESLNVGSFGLHQPKLWRGIRQGENVMVKIYSSRLEAIWTQEIQLYTKLLPSKHDNILRYIGSDTRSVDSRTELWLVTYYQTNGSLVNYLKQVRLNKNGMFKACSSLTHGLLYLHTEISGTKGKLSMAHRNLSSKNVFVKKNGVCALGGFECIATQERLGESNFLQLASKRYMSPELLNPNFEDEIWSLEGFQQADIYSLGLIFWEICRMSVKSKDDVSNYVAPFSEWLGNEREPTIEAMRKLILNEKRRPVIPDHWQTDPTMNALGSIIQECWDTKASMRLPILQIKKAISKLAN